ncbi:MAG: tRNA-binding protein [Bacteroidales bacterium]|nr:tRNA-binding protein [Bacteroidales bacterium]
MPGVDPKDGSTSAFLSLLSKTKKVGIDNVNTKQINVDDFDRVDVRIGTIIAAEANKKARKSAYKLTVDLGSEIGIKTSSAQITELYTIEQLVGRQAVFCVNLVPMHIGSVRSEVRILGGDNGNGVVLLHPAMPLANGTRVF